jgi:hypothetical protein
MATTRISRPPARGACRPPRSRWSMPST